MSKVVLVLPVVVFLIGAYCLAMSYGAEEQVRLFALFEMPKRLGYMLGGVALLGSVIVLVEQLGEMRKSERRLREIADSHGSAAPVRR